MVRPQDEYCPVLPAETSRYLTFGLLLKDSIVELPLGDTSRFFAKTRKTY
jgi:hypothetical protein